MIPTNVPTARGTNPGVCLSAPRSVCASQAKDGRLRSPPAAPGPGPVKRLCLYLPSSPRTVKRMRNLLMRGQDERTDQGRQRGRRQIRPTMMVRWTNMKKLWMETEETGGSLISHPRPLRWFAIHSLGVVSAEPSCARAIWKALKRTPRCAALFDYTWPILAFINQHSSSASFLLRRSSKRAPQFFQKPGQIVLCESLMGTAGRKWINEAAGWIH